MNIAVNCENRDLYTLEVSTESREEFEEAWLLMLRLKSEFDYRKMMKEAGLL